MAHEIEEKDGVARMMFVGKLPWHRLGQKVETEVTSGAAIKLAGLDWEVSKQPIFLKGEQVIDDIPVVGKEIDFRKAIVRDEDKSILGIVGATYEPIQNSECFDFMDEVIGEGRAVYHTAGSLFGGRHIFMVVKFTDTINIGPDLIDKYVLLSSSHDGSKAVQMKVTPIRVVCANTLSVALRNTSGTFSIRHTKSYKQKVVEARQALNLADQYYDFMEQQFNALLETEMNKLEMEQFVSTLIPNTIDKNGNARKSKRREESREKVCELFVAGQGQKEVANTRWAAYNAVTEFIDHNRSTRVIQKNAAIADDLRFETNMYKGGQELRNKAMSLLTT